jgi:hypothetical protein
VCSSPKSYLAMCTGNSIEQPAAVAVAPGLVLGLMAVPGTVGTQVASRCQDRSSAPRITYTSPAAAHSGDAFHKVHKKAKQSGTEPEPALQKEHGE